MSEKQPEEAFWIIKAQKITDHLPGYVIPSKAVGARIVGHVPEEKECEYSDSSSFLGKLPNPTMTQPLPKWSGLTSPLRQPSRPGACHP